MKVKEDVKHDQLVAISRGCEVENSWIKPVRVTKVRKGTLKIVVMEGKKREVRYLVQNAGLPILSLERIRIGGLHLGPLPIGMWREMSPKEREQIFHLGKSEVKKEG